ncbi:MAG: HIRAN domain-containing protein [Syntrophaceae bacterium]
MNRRIFLKTILGLPLLAFGAKAQAKPTPQSALLLQTPVAGFQYYAGERLWPSLNPGAPLTLVREPANPHDEKAVAVYRHGDKLGYIPRSDNAVIANLMDQGRAVQAQLHTKNQGANPWERLCVGIMMMG